MKFLPKNTLAYFNSAFQTHLHDVSALPTSVFAASTKEYRKTCGTESPNELAVTFYALNHAASVVRKSFTPNEPLPEWARVIMDRYTTACLQQGERMLHYILSITTRELRHLSKNTHATDFWYGMEKAAGPAMVAFVKANTEHNEDGAVANYMNHPPTATVGAYIEAMSYGFWKGWGNYAPGNWEEAWNGGYGGPKWALVADAAKTMLTGRMSMEMLVDTGYALAHNGGPIFNKGMMYTHQDASALLTALDVQRSGQILDLMFESQTLGVKKTPEAVEVADLIKAHAPDELKGYVDWKLVNELRPAQDKLKYPNKYAKVTEVQHPWAGKSKPKAKKSVVKPVAPVVTSTAVLLHGKAATVTGSYEVFPHQSVSVVTRIKE